MIIVLDTLLKIFWYCSDIILSDIIQSNMSEQVPTYELNKPIPFNLHLDDQLLSLTQQKLQLARYPEELPDVEDDDWSQGSKVEVVRRLANYWKDGYDWRAEEV